jgi:hypothetical protein
MCGNYKFHNLEEIYFISFDALFWIDHAIETDVNIYRIRA